MKLLTDQVKFVRVACETKNNGSPTLSPAYVDCAGWNRVTWLLVVGDVSAVVNFKIQESADGASWADFDPAMALTEIPAATGDNKVYAVEIERGGSTGAKRYQRAVCTVADNAPGAALAIVAALGNYSGEAVDLAGVDLGEVVS